jgi:tripartite-type tricarboxylate transporter receptor subunit TctC
MTNHARISRRLIVQNACLAALLGSMLGLASAQTGRPVKVLVPTSPGSSADIGARAASVAAQKILGRTLIIENKVGAGGSIAAAALAAADASGDTIGVFGNSFLLFSVEFPQQKFDPMQDVTPVAMVSRGANVLVVEASSAYQSLADIVKKAAAAPGTLSFASAGLGSSTFHSAERVRTAANLDLIHVPFKGSPESINQVVAGRVDFAFAPVSVAAPYIQSGRLRALAVSTSKRSSMLPQVPTTAETVPNSSYESWLAVLVPAKTPLAFQQELNKAYSTAMQTAEIRKLFTTLGVEPEVMQLDEVKAFVRQEYAVAMTYAQPSKPR